MTRQVLIGIDAGTSVVKAVAFDTEGRQLALAARPNSYATLPGGGVEQDLPRTWADTVEVLRELIGRLDGAEILALAVTGQGDGTWLVDEDGTPVGGGLLWLDSRAAAIVAEMDASGARERVFRHTGCGLNACNQSSQLLWLRRHEPERVERAATALHCKDWLYLNLTGVRATDVAEGTFTFGDYRTRAYEPDVLDALGPRRPRPPPAADAGRQPDDAPPPARGRRGHRAPPRDAGGDGLPRRAVHRAGCRPLRPRPRRRLHDHRLDRDAHAPVRERRPCRAGARAHRLHHAVPGARCGGADAVEHGRHPQHRLGGRPRARGRRPPGRPRGLPPRGPAGARRPRARRAAGGGPLPPLHPGRRRARPLRRRQRPRPALRPDQRRALGRPGPLRLRGPGPRRPRLLRRHRPPAGRDPARRRCRPLPGAALDPGERARRPGPPLRAARRRARPAR